MCVGLWSILAALIESVRICPGSCPQWLSERELALVRGGRISLLDLDGRGLRTPREAWNEDIVAIWAPRAGNGLLVLRGRDWGWLDLRARRWRKLVEVPSSSGVLFKFFLPSRGWPERLRRLGESFAFRAADVSADGRRAVFLVPPDIGKVFVADLERGGVKGLGLEGASVSISPDGSKVVVANPAGVDLSDDPAEEGAPLTVVNLDTGKVRRLMLPFDVAMAAWSPDGGRLAVVKFEKLLVKKPLKEGRGVEINFAAVKRPALLTAEGELTAQIETPPELLRRLVEKQKREAKALGRELQRWIGPLRRLPKREALLAIGIALFLGLAEPACGEGPGASFVRWSPDGKMLAAVCDDSLGWGNIAAALGMRSEVHISVLDERLQEIISVKPGLHCIDLLPAWSPDGRAVAFERLLSSGAPEVWLARLPRQPLSRGRGEGLTPFPSSVGRKNCSKGGATSVKALRQIGGLTERGPNWPSFGPKSAEARRAKRKGAGRR